VKLAGTKRDGQAFALSVTARTSRVRLYKEGDVASLDLAGIHAAAPEIAIFETGSDGPTRWAHLDGLAALPKLTDLSLSVDGETDLSVLASAPALRHLHLHMWDRPTFDTSWIAKIPTLTSISLAFHGARPTIELAAFVKLDRVSFSGIANREIAIPAGASSFYVDHSPSLERLAATPGVRTFHVIDCAALRELDTSGFANGPLEVLHLADVPALETMSFVPLGSCKDLRLLTVVGHGIRWLDLTPLAKLASLRGVTVDGKDAPFVDAGPIASPGLRAWNEAGRLQRQI
jgi:hypothetical protein